MATARGGNLTVREKSNGSQEIHQAFEKGKEDRSYQAADIEEGLLIPAALAGVVGITG
jgi:hypothetical protein